jgi:hypothetical protein
MGEQSDFSIRSYTLLLRLLNSTVKCVDHVKSRIIFSAVPIPDPNDPESTNRTPEFIAPSKDDSMMIIEEVSILLVAVRYRSQFKEIPLFNQLNWSSKERFSRLLVWSMETVILKNLN